MIDRCGNSMAAMFWTGDNEDASNANLWYRVLDKSFPEVIP